MTDATEPIQAPFHIEFIHPPAGDEGPCLAVLHMPDEDQAMLLCSAPAGAMDDKDCRAAFEHLARHIVRVALAQALDVDPSKVRVLGGPAVDREGMH